MVYPVNAVPTTAVPEDVESVIAGAAGLIVRTYVAVAVPVELVALIVYVTADATATGLPDIKPVAESKLKPFGSAGEISKLEIIPPVDDIE